MRIAAETNPLMQAYWVAVIERLSRRQSEMREDQAARIAGRVSKLFK